MNWQAAFDGLLALAAFWVVLGPGRHLPALKLGCLLLGSAAVLGTLRFSGLLPLPQLHQFVSLLGAGVGLPLLALALVAPAGAVATQTRFTWIFAVVAAVLCVLLGVVAGIKAKIKRIVHKLDINTLAEEDADHLDANSIGHVEITLQDAIAALPYSRSRVLGSLVLVDTASHKTAGAVLIN